MLRFVLTPKYLMSTLGSSYKVLGIDKSCSTAQIKKRYYELAKQYHPDVNKSDSSHQKFAQITKVTDIHNLARHITSSYRTKIILNINNNRIPSQKDTIPMLQILKRERKLPSKMTGNSIQLTMNTTVVTKNTKKQKEAKIFTSI